LGKVIGGCEGFGGLEGLAGFADRLGVDFLLCIGICGLDITVDISYRSGRKAGITIAKLDFCIVSTGVADQKAANATGKKDGLDTDVPVLRLTFISVLIVDALV
jgi:hypothetical protein